MNEIFKTRLKQLRRERKWNQDTMGAAIGVSRPTICKYERGNVVPPSDVLIVIAMEFGVSADYLLGLSDKRGRI